MKKYKNEMAEVFNRGGFTKGYYYQHNGKDMMSIISPGNVGILIGTIADIRRNQISIKLQKDIFKGDILVLKGKKDEITLTSNVAGRKNEMITLNAPRTQELHLNQRVSRMFCKPLMEELEVFVTEDRKLPLCGKIELITGENARLTLTEQVGEQIFTVVETGALVEGLRLRNQLQKMWFLIRLVKQEIQGIILKT